MSMEASGRCVIRRIAEGFAAASVADFGVDIIHGQLLSASSLIAVAEYQMVEPITIILHVTKLNGYRLA